MKLFLTKITYNVLVLALVVAFFEVISRSDNKDIAFSENPNIQKLQEKSGFQGLELLLVGNSHLYSGIQPQLLRTNFDITAYNLGIATAGPSFFNLVLEDYYNVVIDLPEHIVFTIDPICFSSVADNYLAYPIHRYLERPVSNLKVLRKSMDIKLYGQLLQKSLVKSFQNQVSDSSTPVLKSEHKTTQLGYVASENSQNGEINAVYQGLKNDSFDKRKQKEFMDILKVCKSKKIIPVIFEIPTNRLRDYFSEEYLQEYDAMIKKLKLEYLSVEVPSSQFDDKDFRDLDHLNNNGALKLTHLFGQQWVKMKSLK